MTYKILGSKSDKAEVKVESSGGRSGAGTKEIPDPELEEGKRVLEKKGWAGGWGKAKRLTKIDGEWEVTWSANSSYGSGPNVYRVGAKKKAQKPGAEPTVPRVPGETEPARTTASEPAEPVSTSQGDDE